MKPSLSLPTVFLFFAFLDAGFAAKPPAVGRKLTDIDVIPTRVLQRSISPKFYKSLLISPVQGWIVVHANLAGTRLSGVRVIHSELSGVYDRLALQLANEMEIAGYYSIERPHIGGSVLLHLLIYKIADGTMALSFVHLDEPGGDQARYSGCAQLAVLKSDGKWTQIRGPETLQGKGWAVRIAGVGNNIVNTMKLEHLDFNGSR
jgi:hypothetical protein